MPKTRRCLRRCEITKKYLGVKLFLVKMDNFALLYKIQVIMQKIRDYIEFNVFGVCTVLGERFGIASSRIRLWFIYISFLTFGSPVIIYMVMAFWINLRQYISYGRRNPLRY